MENFITTNRDNKKYDKKTFVIMINHHFFHNNLSHIKLSCFKTFFYNIDPAHIYRECCEWLVGLLVN